MPGRKLKIMVSSTVYGAESDLDQIHAILTRYGYQVIMSKEGSVYVPVGSTNEEACLKAVEDCDLFFGIIFPRYGSGITHKEFLKAVALDKPRWFIAHDHIEYTRKLMQQFMYDSNKNRNGFDIRPTSVLDSLRVVDMYNDVRSSWVQPFHKISDVLVFVKTQFRDIRRREQELNARGNQST